LDSMTKFMLFSAMAHFIQIMISLCNRTSKWACRSPCTHYGILLISLSCQQTRKIILNTADYMGKIMALVDDSAYKKLVRDPHKVS